MIGVDRGFVDLRSREVVHLTATIQSTSFAPDSAQTVDHLVSALGGRFYERGEDDGEP